MSSSSGFKRGLAGSAIAALAITGLPFASSASAAPAAPSANGSVQLISQFNDGSQASARPDGQNSTITLAASVTNLNDTVVFEYNTGNPDVWVPITADQAPQVRNDGYVVAEWNPVALTGANGQATVSLRARIGEGATAQTSTKTGVTVYGPGSTAQNTVNLDEDGTPGGQDAGFFSQPYASSGQDNQNVVVGGSTSATDGNVAVSWFNETTNNFTGTVQAPVTDGDFEGVVDISGFNLAGDPDQIAFGAERDTDDVEDYTLYQQTITEVVATGPAQQTPVGQNGTITVAVTDQNDAPIAGAEVRRQDGTLVGYTDADGEVTDSRPSGSTTQYYANTTDADEFNPGIDVQSNSVTLGSIVTAPTDANAIFDDGQAFDDDEYSTGDIYVLVTDQQGNPVGAGQTVEYRLTAPGGVQPTTFQTATTDAQGRANIAFNPAGADGQYTLEYRVPADRNGNNAIPVTSETFEAGQSSLVLEPAAGSAPAGGEITYTGTLRLDGSNTPLPGRLVNLDYARGAELAPGDGTADAGIVDDGNGNIVLTDTRTTGDGGGFSVTVRDAAVTAPAQQGSESGVLTASTANNVATNANTLDGNANESDSSTAQFNADNSVGAVTIDEIGDGVRPGEVVEVTARVNNTAGNPLQNGTVTFTTEAGFFTPDAANDSDSVENTYDDEGQEITVDVVNGVATAYVTIARDEGFDDDGIVENTVTATSRMGTDSEDFDFDSSDALNGSEVQLVRSPDEVQDTNNEAGAQSGEDAVYFDVFTLDQFGNRTDDIDEVRFDLEGDDENAEIFGNDRDAFTSEGDYGVYVYDETFTGDLTVLAEWVIDTDDVEENDTEETLTDEFTASFYAIDFEGGDYTLETTADDAPQRVGSTVTVTYTALDQFGEPIRGLYVDFFRSGPSGQQGDGNADGRTNANGRISYTFQGTAEGTAEVTAVAYSEFDDEGSTGEPIEASRETVTITFVGDPVVEPPVDPRIQLRGVNNGPAADRLRVQGNATAANSTVELIKFTANGKRVIATKTTNANGDTRFTARDTNGRKFTQYRARLVQDEGTTLSNKRRIR